ncbi:hypothetical protein DB347_02295 [Opitutaceae bacterium EW11]|nr:hypothetical protein DB347_02295 [Opitutaceae bacterium EW11]
MHLLKKIVPAAIILLLPALKAVGATITWPSYAPRIEHGIQVNSPRGQGHAQAMNGIPVSYLGTGNPGHSYSSELSFTLPYALEVKFTMTLTRVWSNTPEPTGQACAFSVDGESLYGALEQLKPSRVVAPDWMEIKYSTPSAADTPIGQIGGTASGDTAVLVIARKLSKGTHTIVLNSGCWKDGAKTWIAVWNSLSATIDDCPPLPVYDAGMINVSGNSQASITPTTKRVIFGESIVFQLSEQCPPGAKRVFTGGDAMYEAPPASITVTPTVAGVHTYTYSVEGQKRLAYRNIGFGASVRLWGPSLPSDGVDISALRYYDVSRNGTYKAVQTVDGFASIPAECTIDDIQSAVATATVTVLPKPVTFTFGPQTFEYDGSVKAVSVVPSDPGATWRVVSGVLSGTEPGSTPFVVEATGNYEGTGNGTLTINGAAVAVTAFTPVSSSYTVLSGPAQGRNYPRTWNEGGAWHAFLAREGVSLEVQGRSTTHAISEFELQAKPPAKDWYTVCQGTPDEDSPQGIGATARRVFKTHLGEPLPENSLIPSDTALAGTWRIRARVRGTDGKWSEWAFEQPLAVVMPLKSVLMTGRTLPPTDEANWFAASDAKQYDFSVWIP